MEEFSTPLMRQYSAIKQRHPNALLFFRLGDFYELFFEDAVVAAKELQITLTSRNKEKGTAIPCAACPTTPPRGILPSSFDVASAWRFVTRWKKRARQEVGQARSHPRSDARDRHRFPSAGAAENNFLASVVRRNGSAGLAFVDLSTGDFRATEFLGDESLTRLRDELDRMRPSELLLASGATSHWKAA